MNRNQLKLNDDKTECLLIGTKQQLENVNFSSITDTLIEAKPEARNPGSWLDSHFDMAFHISKLCTSAFFHLHNIGCIRKF